MPYELSLHVLSVLTPPELEAFGAVCRDWRKLFLRASRDSRIRRPFVYDCKAAQFVDSEGRVYALHCRPASIFVCRRLLEYGSTWEPRVEVIKRGARGAAFCGRGDQPFLLVQLKTALGDELLVYRLLGDAAQLLFRTPPCMPRAHILEAAYHMQGEQFMVVLRRCWAQKGGDCVMLVSPTDTRVVFHTGDASNSDDWKDCYAYLTSAADGCDKYHVQCTLRLGTIGNHLGLQFDNFIFNFQPSLSEPEPVGEYGELREKDWVEGEWYGDDPDDLELFGNSQLPVFQKLELLQQGEETFTWENVTAQDRLFPHPVARAPDGTSVVFFIDKFVFHNEQYAAWVVRRTPPGVKAGIAGESEDEQDALPKDTVYAWSDGEPAFSTALAAGVLVVGLCDSRLLVLKQSEPAWKCEVVHTKMPLRKARVVHNGQASGMFIVSCRGARFVVDVRSVLSAM